MCTLLLTKKGYFSHHACHLAARLAPFRDGLLLPTTTQEVLATCCSLITYRIRVAEVAVFSEKKVNERAGEDSLFSPPTTIPVPCSFRRAYASGRFSSSRILHSILFARPQSVGCLRLWGSRLFRRSVRTDGGRPGRTYCSRKCRAAFRILLPGGVPSDCRVPRSCR